MEDAQSTLKIIIAYDNQDEILGSYFEACKDDILGFLIEQKENGFPLEIAEVIGSDNCHSAYIDIKLNNYQNHPLLVIAYSHGLPHSLRCKSAGYIHSDNIHLFFNSYFSTNSCSSAKELGVSFTGKQGVFIGFDTEVCALLGDTNNARRISINCDNYGIKYSIVMRDKTMAETYKAMKDYYSKKIGELAFFEASNLEEARNALKIHGNVNLTLNDLLNRKD